MAPNKQRCWSGSFGSRPRRPPRPSGRTAAFAGPPCSHQEAARWPPGLQPAADLWESLQEPAGREPANILTISIKMTRFDTKSMFSAVDYKLEANDWVPTCCTNADASCFSNSFTAAHDHQGAITLETK